MTLPIDNLLIDGAKLDANISNNIKPESEIVRSMEGSPLLKLVVHDPNRELLETGLLTRKHKKTREKLKGTPWDYRIGRTRLVIDGRFYLLAGLDKDGSDVTLSWEGRVSWRLRQIFKKVTAERADYTRAQFIKYKVIKPAVPDALVWAPSLTKKQPVEEPEPERVKHGVRVHTGLTIKDVPIDRAQAKDINIALGQADKHKAPARARQALVVAGIGESAFRRVINSLGYGGVFQGQVNTGGRYFTKDDTAEQAESFLLGGRGFQQGGAIHLARTYPRMTPGEIATRVEASGQPGSFYQVYIDEANEILAAYGTGTVDDGGPVTEKVKRVRFTVGGRRNTPDEENHLQGIERLIRDEVNWRFFEDDNFVYIASDFDFLRMHPAMMIAEEPTARQRKIGVQGVGNIDFPYHMADDNARATFSAPADEWLAFPGAVVEIVDLEPMSGKNLLWEFRQSITSSTADITLHRPTKPEREPAPERRIVSTDEVGAVPTKRGNLTYPLAKHGSNLGGVAAHKARAWGNWQSDNAVDIGVPIGTRVFAVDDGTIIGLGGSYDGTGASNPNGYNVTLRTRTNSWFYTHLRSRRPLKIGDTVAAGQQLGETGAANGVPHLHIGSLRGDPEALLGV